MDETALPDVTSVLESTKRRVKETSESSKYEKIAHKIFSDFGDLDGDGAVDANELYAMSLKLYCATTQYMPQVLTPPSLSHVQALFKAFDLDGSGKLNREEFMLLASIWFENCALRIAAQSSICLLLAPLAARRLVGALADVVLYTHEAEPAVDMSRSPPSGGSCLEAGAAVVAVRPPHRWRRSTRRSERRSPRMCPSPSRPISRTKPS